MHQPARFAPAVIVAEEGHLRRKGAGIVVGHDVLMVLVVFLLGLAVGALHLVNEEIIVQLPDVWAVVIGHHSEARMLYQYIVEPLVDVYKRQAVHYKVGSEVREAIEKIGGTMPEDLPTPEKSIAQLEKEQLQRLTQQAMDGQLLLDE